ncbi:hypothetical protein CCAX7_002960 [Capsulimonas corticalis]|uniref:Uncharacterized protein n=1 Tax=Capsulimonas corticalis TaxID=2219043 RepID=A0A402CS50_9BACT|nr:hypothetical protein [Capsulimonas corticalis]BDI28245.1 hypothetical protein CCAX7_002960 [Capsulimonas corticalis]
MELRSFVAVRGSRASARALAIAVCAVAAFSIAGCGSRPAAPANSAKLDAPPPGALKPIVIPPPNLPADMPDAQKQQILANMQQQQDQANAQRQAMFNNSNTK